MATGGGQVAQCQHRRRRRSMIDRRRFDRNRPERQTTPCALERLSTSFIAFGAALPRTTGEMRMVAPGIGLQIHGDRVLPWRPIGA